MKRGSGGVCLRESAGNGSRVAHDCTSRAIPRNVPTPPPTPTPTPPSITDEWFSYDAANRVLVRQSALSGGTVVVDNNNVDSARISYTARGEVASEQRVERQLDAAGRPVGDVRIVTTIEPRYDERGRLLGEWITNPRQGQAGEPALIPLRREEQRPSGFCSAQAAIAYDCSLAESPSPVNSGPLWSSRYHFEMRVLKRVRMPKARHQAQ